MCELCGKTFSERNTMETHKLIHTGKQGAAWGGGGCVTLHCRLFESIECRPASVVARCLLKISPVQLSNIYS